MTVILDGKTYADEMKRLEQEQKNKAVNLA